MRHFTPPTQFRRRRLSYLIQTALVSSLVVPSITLAQQDEQSGIEEVVVTGSFLRGSRFAQDTAMDTITGEDIIQSGAPNMDEYIRTLTYVTNVNVQSIVLGGASGPQDSRGASFNLRGLGENSTLTLVDGMRTMQPRLNSAFPSIAMQRMETVLDGGSALYGSDAVAGVVNLIPIKQYDGFEYRSFFQRPEAGGMDEQRHAMLFGRSFFSDNVDYVGAFENWRRSTLMMYERPREFGASSTMSSAGNPGSWRRLEGASPEPNVGEPFAQQGHGGVRTGPRLLDPACGTFNDGRNERAIERPYPSGTPHSGNFCTFDYGAQAAYMQPQNVYNLYNSMSWEATPWLNLEAQLYNHHRRGNTRGTFTSPNGPNNAIALKVPAEHPANPFGFDVAPDLWRVFTHPTSALPSHITPDTAGKTKEGYWLNRGVVRANYEMAGSWQGTTAFSRQRDKSTGVQAGVHTRKLQLAVHGLGGPSGDEWFNPFGNFDPRAAGYIAGVTDNSQEMNEWLFYQVNNTNSRKELSVFDTVFNGEAFDAPSGLPVLLAFGYSWRALSENQFQNPYDAAGDNFVWGQIDADPWIERNFDTEVRAVFAELEVPILEGLDAKLAVRHEEFTKQSLEATVPKLSVRYEVSSDLSLRASWGQSFLAPTSFDTRRALPNENCGDMFSGRDPLTNELLIGGLRCATGNPALTPETADILNFGFTWQPGGALSGLEISSDYQQIDYTDRIRTRSEDDVLRGQFLAFLSETGLTEANYDPTRGSATRRQADIWLNQNQGRFPVERNPETGAPSRVLIQSANVATYTVDVLDTNIGYRFSPGTLGTFNTRLNVSMFTKYTFEGVGDSFVDALGKQNYTTGAVPPLPKINASWRGGWFRDNKSANVSATWFSSITHDARVVNLFEFEPPFVPPNKIGNSPIVNANYTHRFYDVFNTNTGEISLTVGVNNLFNEKPQLTGQIGGFESRLINNFYRQWQVSIDWRPGI